MKVTNVVLSIGIAVAIFYGLAIGRALLVPFVIAVVLWYLINVLAATFQRAMIGARRPSYRLSLVASLLTFNGLIFIIIDLIARNTVNIIAAAPDYQKNLERLIAEVFEYFGATEPLTVAKLIEEANVDQMLLRIGLDVDRYHRECGNDHYLSDISPTGTEGFHSKARGIHSITAKGKRSCGT